MTGEKNRLRDTLLLVSTGILCAVLSLLFWQSLGEQGFLVLFTLLSGVLLVENFRLRKTVQDLKQRLNTVKGRQVSKEVRS
ncbi:MAG: hypothetical protein AAFQ89_09495 [Cyanobacteria bacterium J06626_18]